MIRSVRRWRRVVATTVFTSLLLAGCIAGTNSRDQAGGDEPSQGPTTLEFWTINLRTNYEPYVQGLIDQFESEHPGVTIEWVDVPGGDMATRLLAAFASGDGPDVVNLDSPTLDRFAARLTDLTPHVPESALSDYQPGLLDSGRRDSALLALPWYSGGATVSWYNDEILTEAGFGNERPTTWEEALDFADRIAESTDACGFSAIPSIEVFQQHGIQMLDPTKTKATFNTAEAAEILERWRQSYRSGGVCPGSVSKDERNFPQTVDNGLAAFSVRNLPFILQAMRDNAPAVYEKLSVAKDVTGSNGTYILSGVQTLAVTKESAAPKLASEFAAFVTNGENQLEFCTLVPIFPSTISTLDDPLFTKIDTGTPVDAARAIVVEQLSETVSLPLGTGKDPALRDALKERVRAFLTSDQSAEDALAAAVQDWEKELAR
ncbi:ABC transporter substrate-binding protein [Saccharopolyspora sp. NPDC002376]